MQTCPEIRLCCWSFHSPWETHCHLGSNCHTFANWTPRTDPRSASVLLWVTQDKELTRNSSYTLLMLLVRAFPRIPPISTFSSFRNWGNIIQCSSTEDLKTKQMIWNLSVSHPPELQCWKTQPSCWVGSGTSQSGGKPFSPIDGHMNASGSDF